MTSIVKCTSYVGTGLVLAATLVDGRTGEQEPTELKYGESTEFAVYDDRVVVVREQSEDSPRLNIAIFRYNLGDQVNLVGSDEFGMVTARMNDLDGTDQYRVRYRAGDGRLVEGWWAQSALYQPTSVPPEDAAAAVQEAVDAILEDPDPES